MPLLLVTRLFNGQDFQILFWGCISKLQKLKNDNQGITRALDEHFPMIPWLPLRLSWSLAGHSQTFSTRLGQISDNMFLGIYFSVAMVLNIPM
jgi:hypothetical protein